MAQVVAVASGKGGVGKTTTVTNLGIYAARKGSRVAIVDVDPLSDIAELLDLPKQKLNELPSKIEANAKIDSYRIEVFENLHLLFPLSKVAGEEKSRLLELLHSSMEKGLKESYDLILLDLPAGADEEENIAFLPFAERILLVTNPDPAAHVAAGTYLSTIREKLDEKSILLWHNRYNGVQTAAFRPGDVIGNYNRNMPQENRLDPADFDLQHFAFIPSDTSLDLLQGGVAAELQLLRNMSSCLDALHESLLSSIPLDIELSNHFRMLLRFFLRNRGQREESEALLGEFGRYLQTILGIASDEHVDTGTGEEVEEATPLFTPEQERALKSYFIACNDNRSRMQLLKAQKLLRKKLELLEQSSSLFSSPQQRGQDPGSAVDRELSALLMFLEEEVRSHEEVRNHSGLILFYFSLYKLLQSDSVRDTIDEFVPMRDEAGRRVRDRHSQIMRLVQHSEDYRSHYLSLIKRLLPLVLRQVQVVSSTFELKGLIFRNGNSPAKEAYAKLTSNFIHEVINSGLGIIVSFTHRPASQAFEKAAKRLLES